MLDTTSVSVNESALAEQAQGIARFGGGTRFRGPKLNAAPLPCLPRSHRRVSPGGVVAPTGSAMCTHTGAAPTEEIDWKP